MYVLDIRKGIISMQHTWCYERETVKRQTEFLETKHLLAEIKYSTGER